MKRKRKKPNDSKNISLFKEYSFELTVFSMVIFGTFLLVENMEISQTLFKLGKSVLYFFADLIKAVRDLLINILNVLEISDMVGVILIVFALYLILIRIRIRLLMNYPKIYTCQHCESSSKLKRIQKKLKHRIIHFVLRLRIYYYQCQDCYKKQLIVLTKK
tara:strand:- start:111 stop:593 length:483 start_codon:yes stop_codon:yes gene_type:complete